MGYAQDICRRLALAVQRQLGLVKLDVRYLAVTPSNRLESLEQGLAQMACGSTTNNGAGRQRVAFTISHFITGTRLMVRRGSPVDRLDHPDLKVVGRFFITEPLAIMLPRNDEALKKIVDDETRRLICSVAIQANCATWFTQPVPPKGASLNLPMSYLLRDFWKHPTDKVP